MSGKETGAVELRQSADGIDWRHVWLKNVLIDSGKLAPTKNARRELRKNTRDQGSTTTVNGTERMLRGADDQSLH
jgi:hypothetical protein